MGIFSGKNQEELSNNDSGKAKSFLGLIKGNLITKNTIVQGSINTKDDITVLGGVKGSINSTKNVEVGGVIKGDIKGNNIACTTGKVTGSLSGKNTVILEDQAMLIGPLNAANISFDAKIKGDIEAEDSINLESNAILLGNLKASNIKIDKGAMIKGKIEIIRDAILSSDLFEMEEEFTDLEQFIADESYEDESTNEEE